MMEFDAVYQEYANAVFRFLFKLSGSESVAEELTQETFFRAFKNQDTYNGACKVSVWLCQIAKNLYFDDCRKKKPLPFDEETPANLSLEDMFGDAEESRELYKILHDLCEPYKEVFTLKVFGELSYQDLSEIFGKSESWVRVVFHRAKLKIVETYQKG